MEFSFFFFYLDCFLGNRVGGLRIFGEYVDDWVDGVWGRWLI